MSSKRPTLLILGLGNDILTDDAVGLHVVRLLREELVQQPQLEIRETTEMGLALLDHLTGFRQAIIVDSIQTGRAEPGYVHRLGPESLQQLSGRTPHFVGVGETLAAGRQLGLEMPETVGIFAIEIADPFTVSASLSPSLTQALPAIVKTIRREVKRMLGE